MKKPTAEQSRHAPHPWLAAALAAIDRAVGDSMDEKNLVHAAMARGLLHGYHAKWCDAEVDEILAVEQEFTCGIYNLASKRVSKSRTFQLAGKTDLLVRRNGKVCVWDHKTTSEKIAEDDAVYWRHLIVENQATLYLLAQHYQNVAAAGVMWDAIHKPAIRPKSLPKAEQKAITSLGTYCGFGVSENTKNHVLATGREDAELFEYRVARACLDDPERYFKRKPTLRLREELAAYAEELWQLTQEVAACRRGVAKTDHLPIRNSGACLMHGRPCEYLGICSNMDSPDSDKWRSRESVHEELATLDSDGRNVLTFSRLRCFQTCQRKHHYRYELGIERQDRITPDALYFGSMFHEGLNAWWTIQQKEETHANSKHSEIPAAEGAIPF
ncbi:hypothetical protein CMI37_14295 [Candidatus Pacearchaeota archaeon]|nr:hypothetical protein [Candidatus Pacearchaeota archaeon]|tara:strand:+ start:1391 stop:2545 length:1155 start_codon:yes stop_codon:yes gene_type:complete